MNCPRCRLRRFCGCRRTIAGLGQHPQDIPGHLRRDEVWSRIVFFSLVGVSLGIASVHTSDASDADVASE